MEAQLPGISPGHFERPRPCMPFANYVAPGHAGLTASQPASRGSGASFICATRIISCSKRCMARLVAGSTVPIW